MSGWHCQPRKGKPSAIKSDAFLQSILQTVFDQHHIPRFEVTAEIHLIWSVVAKMKRVASAAGMNHGRAEWQGRAGWALGGGGGSPKEGGGGGLESLSREGGSWEDGRVNEAGSSKWQAVCTNNFLDSKAATVLYLWALEGYKGRLQTIQSRHFC